MTTEIVKEYTSPKLAAEKYAHITTDHLRQALASLELEGGERTNFTRTFHRILYQGISPATIAAAYDQELLRFSHIKGIGEKSISVFNTLLPRALELNPSPTDKN